MPTVIATPWPNGPVVASMPDVHRYSGWPGHRLPSCRNCFKSSSGTASSLSTSYLGFTAFTPLRCSNEYNSVEACPTDNTKRSRFGQIGCSGSNRRNRCHRQYATGASAMGVPGWPELACWTASMHNVRIVLMASSSMSFSVTHPSVCLEGLLVTGLLRAARFKLLSFLPSRPHLWRCLAELARARRCCFRRRQRICHNLPGFGHDGIQMRLAGEALGVD